MSRFQSLNVLYPEFCERLRMGLIDANKDGIPLRVFETYRSWYRQTKLYEQGRTYPGRIVTNAKAGTSWHNYGLAADLVLFINDRWSWRELDLYHRAAQHFEKYNLNWLGRSKKFPELVHYELKVPFTISEAQNIYHEKGGILGVWNELDQFY